MKQFWLFPLLIILLGSGCKSDSGATSESPNQESAKVVGKADTVEVYAYRGSDAIINNKLISSLGEAEKAILAYYCLEFNTSCMDARHCKLTEALGLGEQGSSEHLNLVAKWLKDQETKDLVKMGGRVTPNGAEPLAWFERITMLRDGNSVQVFYISNWVSHDLHGKGQGYGNYLIQNGEVKVLSRNHVDIDI